MTNSSEGLPLDDGAPICIVDTCIGGLSVVKSLWKANVAADAMFISDYAVNPLGVKSDAEIGEVADRWIGFAKEQSDTLLIACNTLSIRYQQLSATGSWRSMPDHAVSMVDCIAAMAGKEANRLEGRNVLVVGTEFTASQSLYSDLLSAAVPGVRVSTVAATALERSIARFESRSMHDESILTDELQRALRSTDVAVLACTCFPMVRDELESLFPAVEFLNPGSCAPALLPRSAAAGRRRLRIRVTGNVVSADQVKAFATRYLGSDSIDCC